MDTAHIFMCVIALKNAVKYIAESGSRRRGHELRPLNYGPAAFCLLLPPSAVLCALLRFRSASVGRMNFLLSIILTSGSAAQFVSRF